MWSIFFSFSLQGELWTRTVAISHVFSLIIMMIVSVYIMAQCAAADTGDTGDWHFPCCDPPHRNICNLHAFYRDTVWTSCRMTWNNTQWISFNDISFRAIVFKINSIPWTFQCNPGLGGGAAGGCPLYFVERHKLSKFFINGPCYISLAPLGQVTPDRGQLTVELY